MATQTLTNGEGNVTDTVDATVLTGPAAAAMIAGGIGTFTIGLMTTLTGASASLGTALKWVAPVGPLSGKTGVGIIVWLISWLVLGLILKNKNSSLSTAFTITIILIIAGFLLTFPPFFEIFAAG
jgi:hypothetical protein